MGLHILREPGKPHGTRRAHQCIICTRNRGGKERKQSSHGISRQDHLRAAGECSGPVCRFGHGFRKDRSLSGKMVIFHHHRIVSPGRQILVPFQIQRHQHVQGPVHRFENHLRALGVKNAHDQRQILSLFLLPQQKPSAVKKLHCFHHVLFPLKPAAWWPDVRLFCLVRLP